MQNRMQIDNWSSPAVFIHPTSRAGGKMGESCAQNRIGRAHRTVEHVKIQSEIRWKIPPTNRERFVRGGVAFFRLLRLPVYFGDSI